MKYNLNGKASVDKNKIHMSILQQQKMSTQYTQHTCHFIYEVGT